uniref:C2 domain-containing protein n=1 Tax=Hemiselmis andersenii TaxID=464988 RepID=A0A6U4NBC7_HEMAN|mmetsp:Transcript_50001/g.121379  ORF Transcript_50001/g.121379 Transcript_50001/m.121379 type:complete len:821 (+) Transcript_50001:581-3043(+)
MGCGASSPAGHDPSNTPEGQQAGAAAGTGPTEVSVHSAGGASEARETASQQSDARGGEENDSMGRLPQLGALPDVSGVKFERGIHTLLGSDVSSRNSAQEAKPDLGTLFKPLMEEHARFLFNFVLTFHMNSNSKGGVAHKVENLPVTKPKLEARQFKSHTMDNVRVRKMCDELLQLEDPTHKMADETAKGKPWMRTLQVSRGKHIHSIRMNNNPDVTIGGYFIISQMLGYIRGLVSLDLSSNELRGAEARVLALGLKYNKSIQDLCIKENSIGTEGATSLADALQQNSTLLFLDLRMNNIRGPGVCVLTDAMTSNRCLTQLDLRWNYTGESSDYVEQALVDLQAFCARNLKDALTRTRAKMEAEKLSSAALDGSPQPEEDSPGPAFPNGHANSDNGSDAPSGRPGEAAPDKLIAHPSMDHFASGDIRPDLHPSRSDLTGESDRLMDDNHIIGRLEVTIISAKNLPQVIWTSGKDGEFLGLPQAYCVFQCNKQRSQSHIMKKDWNPRWDYSCTMDVRSVWNVCAVQVKHSKTLTRTHKEDSMIGTANLPIGAVINWRGVSKSSDGSWRAYHRPIAAGRGSVYHVCKGKDRNGKDTDVFDSSELAAKAYDESALKKDLDKAVLNFSGEAEYIGQHVKEELFPLAGEDGVDVIGVQAGVSSAVRLRLKYFDLTVNYLEICLEKAACLPRMDAGLGSCDAYCVLCFGDYSYKSRVVRNSLDPHFKQTFRVQVPNDMPETKLLVQVWDWDRFDDDDHMGDAEVHVTIDSIQNGTLNGGYGVKKADEGGNVAANDYLKNAKGEKSIIHLSFSYHPAKVTPKAPLEI